MEYLAPFAVQSALMPANLITLAHFSVSSAMNLPKSAGEPASTVPPRSASRALILGSARAALIPLLSSSTISFGVAFGAPTPNQKLPSYPGTNSLTVGTSGNGSERVALVIASGRTLPALMYPIELGMGSKKTWTCPASRSVITGPRHDTAREPRGINRFSLAFTIRGFREIRDMRYD